MENAVIVDVEPTPARTYDEVESTKAMLVRTEQRFHLKPKRLAADTAYGTGRFLGWLVGCGIAPHIPVRDASNALRYHASKFDWAVCSLKTQCCPNTPARQIPRDVHEDARDLARRLMGTKRFLKSRDERKRVEMRFAHLKIHHGFERMRLRGLSGTRDEFHLAAIVQNLKTLALRS
jgi:Transposase DDE domain